MASKLKSVPVPVSD